MGLENSKRFAVNEIEFVQRVAMEMRRRPAWVEEIDDTPSRLPMTPTEARATPANRLVQPRPARALQADWRSGFKQVSSVYRQQFRPQAGGRPAAAWGN